MRQCSKHKHSVLPLRRLLKVGQSEESQMEATTAGLGKDELKGGTNQYKINMDFVFMLPSYSSGVPE